MNIDNDTDWFGIENTSNKNKKYKYLIKKDFTNLGQRDFRKKLSNDNYVYIVYQRVLSPWGRTQIHHKYLRFFFFYIFDNYY